MSVLLGCIADDFTGATDIASFLVASGMRTVQLIGVPEKEMDLSNVDAVVVALKSRTQETQAAINDSVDTLKWLKNLDCEQYYFKYCSTFDSTVKGNIGPVADALLEALDEKFSIVCPALPVNGRTIYKGHLFVGNTLLNESGMENHPLTPMTDANVVRLLSSQTSAEVGLVDFDIINQGVSKTKEALELLSKSCRYAVVDTLTTEHLMTIGHACRDVKLLTGGSGLAIGLADNFESKGLFTKSDNSSDLASVSGEAVIISGSCSKATREQVAIFQKKHPSFKVDPVSIQQGDISSDDVINWYEDNKHQTPLMIYATDSPKSVKASQEKLGVEQAGLLVEELMADVVAQLAKRGVNKFVVAGGETSGSVVQALNISSLKVGSTIAPGVPVMQTLSVEPKLVALKSGNFGDKDFFEKALQLMV